MTFENTLRKLSKIVLVLLISVCTLIPVQAVECASEDGCDTYGEIEDGYYAAFSSKTINDQIFNSQELEIDLDGDNIRQWLSVPSTYTVIKSTDSGYKFFFNSPNLQQLAQNYFMMQLGAGGFIGQTYNAKDTSWLVKAGGSSNAMQYFGFNIPSNVYSGEYPHIVLNVSEVIPTTLWSVIKRVFKTVFLGRTFIQAPNAKEYATLRYERNHTYSDKESRVVSFLQKYWEDGFINQIDYPSSIGEPFNKSFSDARQFLEFVLSNYVSTSTAKSAKSTIESINSWISSNQSKVDAAYQAKADDAINLMNWEASVKKAQIDIANARASYANLRGQIQTLTLNPGNLPSSEIQIALADIQDELHTVSTELINATTAANLPKPEPTFTAEMQQLINEYNNKLAQKRSSEETIAKYKVIMEALKLTDGEIVTSGSPTEDADDKIYWNQCFIYTEDDKCVDNKKYPDETEVTISTFELLANGNLYKLKVTNESTAEKLVDTLITNSGPYTGEVLDTITAQIIQYKGDAALKELNNDDNVRIMPYDIDSMTKADRHNIKITDKRVSNSFIKAFTTGGLLLVVLPKMFDNAVSSVLLNILGRISELTVTLNSFISFKALDSLGISPTDFWLNPFFDILVLGLIIYALVKIMNTLRKALNAKLPLMEFVKQFLIFTIAVSTIGWLQHDPKGAWGKISELGDNFINVGETTVLGVDEDTAALFGDGTNASVAYWIPYFDAWSYYNTGYSITDTQNVINLESGMPEVQNAGTSLTMLKYGENTLWSAALADSFVQNGYSNQISKKAYRVVDHFLAPRIIASKTGANLKINSSVNENYNGMFQSWGVPRVLSKAISILHLFVLVVVKFLTFAYAAYLFYVLIFNVLLAFGNSNNRSIKVVLKEIGITILEVMVIGMYSGLVVQVGTMTAGFGAIVQLLMCLVSFGMLRYWHEKFMRYFPKPLDFVMHIVDWIIEKVQGIRGKMKNAN